MTNAPVQTAAAPEVKTLPDHLGSAFDEFMVALEAFKDANDRRLGEIEKKLSADVLTEEKVERINRAIDEQKALIDGMLLRRARPPLSREPGGSLEFSEHKAAFDLYFRRGDESRLKQLEEKALSAGSPADGGYLVPPELDTAIGRRLSVVSPIRALATVREISTALLQKPFATTGMATGWAAETAQRPQTGSASLVSLSFPTMELYAMPAASQALLDDAAVDVEAWIASEVEIVFSEQEGAAFVNGDGTNRPRGILNYPAVADASWSWGNLGFLLSGAPGAFRAAAPSDVLVDLIYSLKAGYRQNATFLMNRKTQAEIRKIKTADGRYLWQPPATPGAPASLIGFPLSEAEDMPDMASATPALAFGDFRSGYLVVDRRGLRLLRDPYSAKPYVLFYITKRVGGGIQNFEAIKLLKFSDK